MALQNFYAVAGKAVCLVMMCPFVVYAEARDLRKPVVPTAEDGEDGSEREHIVEVRHDVISAVRLAVDAAPACFSS